MTNGEMAIQDQMEPQYCFGCGTANEQGLRIKSYWTGDEAVCTFQPSPHHAAGPGDVLNGGIIATLIDCHCVCLAIADAYRTEGRPLNSEPPLWCATASLHVDYLRPTPLGEPIELRARIVERGGRKTRVACSLTAGGLECARAEVLAVRVSPSWTQRPQTHPG